jgi:hypothetical protein
MPPRSHLKKRIDRHIRDIEEKGLRHRFEVISIMSLPKGIFEEPDRVVSVDLDNLQGIFLLWVFGCLMSALVFVGELVWRRIASGGE